MIPAAIEFERKLAGNAVRVPLGGVNNYTKKKHEQRASQRSISRFCHMSHCYEAQNSVKYQADDVNKITEMHNSEMDLSLGRLLDI